MSLRKRHDWLARICVVSCLCLVLVYTRRSHSSCACQPNEKVARRIHAGDGDGDGDAFKPNPNMDGRRMRKLELQDVINHISPPGSKELSLLQIHDDDDDDGVVNKETKSAEFAAPSVSPKREIEWTTMAMLAGVLERLAVNRTVIICTVNAGYWNLFVNWLVSLDRLGLADRLLVFAEDVLSWQFLEDHWPGHAVLFGHHAGGRDEAIEERARMSWFGTKVYGQLVSRRPAQILACLEHGYDVLYSDIDSVFVRNPLPYFYGDFHIGFAWDGPLKLSWLHGKHHELPPAGFLDFCTALLYCKSTPQSIELMQRWMINLRQSKVFKNQPAFNSVLGDIRSANDTFFHFQVLPMKDFPSGYIMSEPSRVEEWKAKGGGDPAVVHLNFYYGDRDKIRGFKKHNLWYLNESSTSKATGSDGSLEWPSSLSLSLSSSSGSKRTPQLA